MNKRLKRFLRLSIFAVVTITVAMLGVLPIGVAYLYVDTLVNHECTDPGIPLPERITHPEQAQALTFSPTGQFDLDAWLVTGDNGAGIVVLSGAWAGHNTMHIETDALHQAGYTILTYDTRSCANPPQRTSLGYAEREDLQAAIDILIAQPGVDPDRIGVFGHSMGGATAIFGAAQDERIQAIVATGNYGDLASDIRRNENGDQGWFERYTRGWIERIFEWQTDINLDDARPVRVISDVSPRSVFLMHGSKELQNTRGQAQFDAANEPKTLWIVEGAGHGGYFNAAPEEYTTRIVEFFDTYLNHD